MTIRHLLLSSVVAFSIAASAPSSAQIFLPPIDVPIVVQPTWKCRRWDLSPCTSTDLTHPAYRQVLVLPTGYADTERAQFWADFDAFVSRTSSTGAVWSTQKREKLLHVGFFVGGGALGTATAAFHGAIASGAIGGAGPVLREPEVMAKVNEIRASTLPGLKPLAVAVVFNDARPAITASSTNPTYLRRQYGIARMTRAHLDDAYVLTHEMSHAAMGWLDEYVEEGFENLSVRTLDVATPLLEGAVADRAEAQSLSLSEILASNGSDNLSLSPYPATVASGYRHDVYEYEGGLGFGPGTFHMRGANLMNDDRVMRGADDGFAFAHSVSQQGVVETMFDGAPARANDRIRNAGPSDGWPTTSSTTTVVLFDADKNHRAHPTKQYDVLVGWYQKEWKTCWNGSIPYPCYEVAWRTMQRVVHASVDKVRLPGSALRDVPLLHDTLCRAGVREALAPDGTPFALCDRPVGDLPATSLPTVELVTPYQTVSIPTPEMWTTYYWRFRTRNGIATSGSTSWSSVYRVP